MQNLINKLSQYENFNENDQEDIPDDKLTVQLIMKTSLDPDITSSLSEDEKLEILINLKSIHLEYMNIKKIENMDIFDKTKILMLQNNQIEQIDGLECMISLEYLNLRDNKIKEVENLKTLKKLTYLNIGNNQIEDINPIELPEQLEFLIIQGNPVNLNDEVIQKIISRLKYLDELNDREITQEYRFKALGIFPKHLEKYAQSIKTHRTSSARSSRRDLLSAQSKAPDVINDRIVDDTVMQIREKTDELIEHCQKTQKEELNNNYKDLMEYCALQQQIREDIRKNSLVNKKLENSMTM